MVIDLGGIKTLLCNDVLSNYFLKYSCAKEDMEKGVQSVFIEICGTVVNKDDLLPSSDAQN